MKTFRCLRQQPRQRHFDAQRPDRFEYVGRIAPRGMEGCQTKRRSIEGSTAWVNGSNLCVATSGPRGTDRRKALSYTQRQHRTPKLTSDMLSRIDAIVGDERE